MNIVQLLPEFEEGGVEGETLDFAIYLAEQGHKSIVISEGGRMVEQLVQAGGHHLTWPHIGEKSFRCLPYINKLRKFFLTEKIDVVHLRSRLPAWLGYLAWKTVPAARRPVLITTFHGFYSINSYSGIMTRGERVIAVSRAIKDHILDHYKVDESRIDIVHGGCDMDSFDPDAVSAIRLQSLREKWAIPDGLPLVMLPGRLTGWKGQHIFLESLASLDDLSFYAVCVGEIDNGSSYVEKLKETILKKNLQDKVQLVGHCSDMPAAMLLADVVVSASSSKPEAFGKVAIEAMAMGKPVVATRHGGSLESVVDAETGWLVPPDNPGELAAALRRVLTDKELLIKAGDNGRQRVLNHFTARHMCEKTLAVYNSVLKLRKVL